MKGRIPFSTIRRKVSKLLKDCQIDANFTSSLQRTPGEGIDLNGVADFLDIHIISHDFSDDISGIFFKKDNDLILGVNKNHVVKRQRFTIAHEIGHHILHSDSILHYDESGDPELQTMDEVYFRADRIQSSQETEANYFAAELLMPETLIDRCVEEGLEYLEELADKFNVSTTAMRYRLVNLGYL